MSSLTSIAFTIATLLAWLKFKAKTTPTISCNSFWSGMIFLISAYLNNFNQKDFLVCVVSLFRFLPFRPVKMWRWTFTSGCRFPSAWSGSEWPRIILKLRSLILNRHVKDQIIVWEHLVLQVIVQISAGFQVAPKPQGTGFVVRRHAMWPT